MVVERRSPRRQSPQGQEQSPHQSPSLRKPLHERSDSQSNERSQRSSPEREYDGERERGGDHDYDWKQTNDDSERFYSTSPFPSRPSQILSPKGFNRQGYAESQLSVSQQERVSDAGHASPHQTHTNSPSPSPRFDLFDDESLKPARLSPKPKHKGKGKEKEETNTVRLVNASDSPAHDAARFRADTAGHPKSNEGHGPSYYGMERIDPGWPLRSTYSQSPGDSRAVVQDEATTGLGILHPHKAAHASRLPTNVATESAQSRSPTLPPFVPANSFNATKHHASGPSLSPSLSSDSTDATKGPQYSPFPSTRTSLRRRSSVTAPPPKANPQRSSESLTSASGTSQSSTSHRVSVRAVPSDDALEAAVASGATIQYPAVRSPSAQSSWADSSITVPKRLRMNERTSPRLHQWNAHPPTIQPESGQTSQTYTQNGSPRYVSPTSTDPRDSSMNFIVAKLPSNLTLDTSQRQFAEGRRDVTGSTIRVVYESDEHGDTVRDLRSPVIESPRKAASDLHRGDSGSGGSFISSSIPLWARYFHRRSRDQGSAATNKNAQKHSANRFQRIYYGRGGPDPLGAPGSSIDGDDSRPSTTSRTAGNLPLGIFRTRGQASNDMEISELPPNVEVEITGPPRSRSGGEWTPRLHPDRRAKTVSIWQPPPLQEKPSGGIFSRLNIQIVLFCLGFVFPFAWMIAAILPLPPYPDFVFDPRTSSLDLENMIARDAASIERAIYQRARWWRSLNRIMSIVGLLLIGAIVALATVAVHMRSNRT
ncbi:hypothetical protein FGG08_004701 [Glutinoglossum americanum]|uniref:Serine-rich protein n=1 Tax=Glutinoglossum americanum TaxID=1670608 RepID=A0A9P8I4L0_9PEZI|nr:hypothetical protein FGG08_004701 [Glutinoglossum americanum]